MNKRNRYLKLAWVAPMVMLSGAVHAQIDESLVDAKLAVSAPERYVFGRQLEQRLFNQWELTSSWYTQPNFDPKASGEDITVRGFRVDLDRTILNRRGSDSGIGLGIGWQRQVAHPTYALAEEHDGPRLSLVGRLQISDGLRLYGRTAWLPQIGDRDPGEFEAGFYYDVRPSISLRAGVRWFNAEDLDRPGFFGQRRYMLGAGVSW